MPTNGETAALCAAIYDPSFKDWDYYWDGTAPDGICAGIVKNNLIFRGSITKEDWERDFEVIKLGAPKEHPQFGIVHAGMDEGLDEFCKKAFPFLGDGASFGGHSLGAAHAWGAAGRYVLGGSNAGGITVFGSPKYGCRKFAEFIAPYPKASYRNGLDPVTEVPFLIGLEVAVAPQEPKNILIEPADWSEGPMAWHSVNLYKQGVQSIGA